MRTDLKLAAGTLAAAGLLAVPASASAVMHTSVALGPTLKCYEALPGHSGAEIPLTLTGGTPGDSYQVVATYPNHAAGSAGSIAPTSPFDASGNGSANLTGIFPEGDPITPIEGRPVDLSVEDFNATAPGGETTTPLGSVLVTNLTLNISSEPTAPVKPRSVAISGIGFADKQLYGFITNAKGTKVLRRWYLGKGNVCGFAEHKEVVAPTHPAFGSYRMYVNPGPKLDKRYSLSIPFTIETI